MRRTQNGMGGYRGRRTLHDVLKIIAVVLAILVGLVLLGLFLGQRYIFYSEDGLRLELPFFSREEKHEDKLDPDSLNLGEESKSDQSEQTDRPDDLPDVREDRNTGLELPVEAILDGSAAQKLADAGADVLVVTMKARSGQLSWQSQQPMALNSKVNGDPADVNEKLRAWNRGDVYTVARVVCFPDDAVPYHNGSTGIRVGKGNWRDETGSRWMDPTRTKAQEYLVGLCDELAQLGFDEILLEEASCPLNVPIAEIPLEGSDPEGAVTSFLTKVEETLQPYGTVLSVRTTPDILKGTERNGGLTAKALEEHVDHIWVPAQPEELQSLLTAAGISRSVDRAVALVDTFRENAETAQAVLTQQAS